MNLHQWSYIHKMYQSKIYDSSVSPVEIIDNANSTYVRLNQECWQFTNQKTRDPRYDTLMDRIIDHHSGSVLKTLAESCNDIEFASAVVGREKLFTSAISDQQIWLHIRDDFNSVIQSLSGHSLNFDEFRKSFLNRVTRKDLLLYQFAWFNRLCSMDTFNRYLDFQYYGITVTWLQTVKGITKITP